MDGGLKIIMRKIFKEIPLSIEEKDMKFRMKKLDAFSGVKVLKMISGSSAGTLQEMIFSLPEWEMESLMKVCLKHCEVMLPAGWIVVYDDGCWGIPEMETETMVCFRLMQEEIAWSLEDFFGEGGSAS